MKSITLLFFLFIGSVALFAQQNDGVVDMEKHKIVMQFTDSDSLSQATVLGQVKNIRTAWPNADIEVVCHGGALDMLQTSKSKVTKQITEWSGKGVVFAACHNTMKRRNIKKEELLSPVIVVPSAMIEITLKQEANWSYVKGGH
jgi:intracellular sulfur oxidation DsrE/DsrF family protein